MTAPVNARDRAALYAPQVSAAALAACARYADQVGLRVVTIVDEDLPGSTPLAGHGLNRLVDRLAAREFEVVVAHAGEGRLLTLATGFDTDAQPDPVRCAIYMRCATSSPDKPYPLADQWDACEAYAVRKGWETIATYKDQDVSGRRTSRPGLDSVMAKARQGAFELLLIEDLNRLSRDPLHLHALLTELKGLGVAVHTTAGPVDPGCILPEARS